MEHYLWLAALGRNPRLPISREEYEALGKAWETIIALLEFEEEFDSVIQNYIELEQGFLSTAIHSMVISESSLVAFRKHRLKFARLLSNLLSSCRSYLDHASHVLGMIGTDVANAFSVKTNEAYDSEFAYRLMEALRNYAQHRGSSLHGTTFNSQRVDRDESGFGLKYSVWASIDVSKLREDKDFKRSILKDVEKDRLDVLALCRIYIEKLGEIHSSTRKDLELVISSAKELLRGALERYENETGEGRIGVGFGRSRSDQQVDFQGIPEDIIELYESLVSQNRHVVNLRHRFVSNELLPERRA